MEFSNVINNGMFGTSTPLQQPNYSNQIPFYNPFMVNIGGQGYSYNYKPREDYYNPFPQYYPQQNNMNYNDYVAYVRQYIPTYDPNKTYEGHNYYSGNNFYGYGYRHNPYDSNYYYGYNGYSPLLSMSKREQIMKDKMELNKFKLKMNYTILGIKFSDDSIDQMFDPNLRNINKSEEEQQKDREWNKTVTILNFINNPVPVYSEELQIAQAMNHYLKVYHETLDNHSLCEFLEEDYPRMMREFWIRENINPNGTRNLNGTYKSKDYNDLLELHSKANPYLMKLLKQEPSTLTKEESDTVEMGIEELMKFAKARRDWAAEKLRNRKPMYLSSPEVQEQRRRFNEELQNQLYERNHRTTQPDTLLTVAQKNASRMNIPSSDSPYG